MKKWIVFLIVLLIPIALFAQGDNGNGGGFDLWHWISVIATALFTFFAGLTKWLKNKSNKMKVVGQEFVEFAMEIRDVTTTWSNAMEDKQLSKEELQAVIKEIKDIPPAAEELLEAAKNVFKKVPAV